jgi:hypothetical protein
MIAEESSVLTFRGSWTRRANRTQPKVAGLCPVLAALWCCQGSEEGLGVAHVGSLRRDGWCGTVLGRKRAWIGGAARGGEDRRQRWKTRALGLLGQGGTGLAFFNHGLAFFTSTTRFVG